MLAALGDLIQSLDDVLTLIELSAHIHKHRAAFGASLVSSVDSNPLHPSASRATMVRMESIDGLGINGTMQLDTFSDEHGHRYLQVDHGPGDEHIVAIPVSDCLAMLFDTDTITHD